MSGCEYLKKKFSVACGRGKGKKYICPSCKITVRLTLKNGQWYCKDCGSKCEVKNDL